MEAINGSHWPVAATVSIVFALFNCLGNKVAGKCSCEDVLNVIIWTVFIIDCSLETPFGKLASVFLLLLF